MLLVMTLSAPTAAGACHREELRDVTHATLKTEGRRGTSAFLRRRRLAQQERGTDP